MRAVRAPAVASLVRLHRASASGRRMVVFAVAGEIVLADHPFVQGAFVAIDSGSAPTPGITLRGELDIRVTLGAHDVIVEGLYIGGSPIHRLEVGNDASHARSIGQLLAVGDEYPRTTRRWWLPR